MLEQSSERLVSVQRLGPDPGVVDINAFRIARSVRLSAFPDIVIVVLDDGQVLAVTTESAVDARLI